MIKELRGRGLRINFPLQINLHLGHKGTMREKNLEDLKNTKRNLFSQVGKNIIEDNNFYEGFPRYG